LHIFVFLPLKIRTIKAAKAVRASAARIYQSIAFALGNVKQVILDIFGYIAAHFFPFLGIFWQDCP